VPLIRQYLCGERKREKAAQFGGAQKSGAGFSGHMDLVEHSVHTAPHGTKLPQGVCVGGIIVERDGSRGNMG
jgi:hypothetical protein